MKSHLRLFTVIIVTLFTCSAYLVERRVSATSSNFVVTNTNDLGPGSLRQAISDANANAGADTISFNIPASDGNCNATTHVCTITLASGLSSISDDVTIDGTAQSIVVSGNNSFPVLTITTNKTLTVASLTIANGVTTFGGGIHNEFGTVNVNNCTFTGNSAINGGTGGGIFNLGGTVSVANSTFSGNTANGASGGAIENTGGGTLNVTNSTFFGNSANSGGGGISNNTGAFLNVINSTFSANITLTGATGAAIDNGGTLNFSNTIIANSSYPVSGNDCRSFFGTIGTNKNNLVMDGSCSPALTGDPKLGPLAANGGATQTMSLLTGSPAIDAGTDMTTLSGNIDNAMTTITVADASAFPAGVGFLIQIDNEQMNVTAKSANTLTVSRGANSTTAATHNNGAAVNSAFDQRGSGFRRKADGDNNNSAVVDIGAFEVQPTPSLPHIALSPKSGPTSAGGSITFNATTDPGLAVRMQSTTTPNTEGSWTTLPNGNMTEVTSGHYSLTTTNYPISDGLYFRAISSKTGLTDGKSDPIGPYDLKTLPHLSFAFNGPTTPGTNATFTASTYSGVTVRVQSFVPTTTCKAPTDTGCETTWTDLPDGNSGHMHEDSPGNYSLSTTSYPNTNSVYFRAISSQTGFNDGRSDVFGPFNLAPAAPAQGGLSATTFTVNESASSQSGLADTVLRFAAQQTGTAAGLKVRVQATNTDGSWTDLPGGGQMSIDATTGRYILNTRDYPQRSGVSFRAIASASAYADSISNSVGTFDLTASKPHLGPIKLGVTANGYISDWYFLARVSDIPSGFKVRIQSTTTPAKEDSWSDLSSVSSPYMNQSTNTVFANAFILLANKLPDACGVYFRAVASADGYVDGISNAVGSFNITQDNPPQVNTVALSGKLIDPASPNGPNNPLVVEAGNVTFSATVSSTNPLNLLRILCDYNQNTIVQFNHPVGDGTTKYQATFNVDLGDHVIESIAVDDVTGCDGQLAHAMARNGSGPIYIRVVPQGAAGAMAQFEETNVAPTASGPRAFHAVGDGYWDDPQTWKDAFGSSGVPTFGDSVLIEHHAIHFALATSGLATSVTLNDATLIADAGTSSVLVVNGTLTINACHIVGEVALDLEAGAVGNLDNPANVLFDRDQTFALPFGAGKIVIHGTLNVHGVAGSTGADRIEVGAGSHIGKINWLPPLQICPNAAADPASCTRMISANQLNVDGQIQGTFSTLLTSDGAGLIGHDGAGLIGHDGAGLIGNSGSTLIGNSGSTIVAQGGGNIVAQGGGNLIGNSGSTLIGNSGSTLIGNSGSTIVAQGGGNLIGNSGSTITSVTGNSAPEAKSDSVTSSSETSPSASSNIFFVQTGGATDLSSCNIVGPVALYGGTLSGSGSILGDLTNYGGSISPGHSPGGIGVTGNFSQSSHGRLVVEDGGKFPTQFDQLQVGGSAQFAGILEVRLTNGYAPDKQDTFSPLGYKSATGSFDSISADAKVTLNANGLLTTVDPSIPIAMINFAATNVTVTKDAGHAILTLSRTGDTSNTVTLTYATQDGTATEQSDYSPVFGSLAFNPGESSKDVSIPLINNGYGKNSAGTARYFQLVLDNAIGGQIQIPNAATITINNNNSADSNPLPDAGFFVREQYLDFLGREPDTAGQAFWVNTITTCGSDQNCIDVKRINASAAFFLSIEFQQEGYLVERAYKAAYGDDTGTSTLNGPHQMPVPIVRFDQFLADSAEVGQGVIVNQGNWQQQLDLNKDAFMLDFVQRQRFVDAYPTTLTPTQFVSKLFTNAGVTPAASDLATAVGRFGGAATSTNPTARAKALRDVTENATLISNELNRAFVLMEYYGYLRRNPNEGSDVDYTGYDFWLSKLNQFNGDYIKAEMVKAFITSREYRLRFGP